MQYIFRINFFSQILPTVNGNEKVFNCQENQEFHASKDSSENGAHHSNGAKNAQHNQR